MKDGMQQRYYFNQKNVEINKHSIVTISSGLALCPCQTREGTQEKCAYSAQVQAWKWAHPQCVSVTPACCFFSPIPARFVNITSFANWHRAHRTRGDQDV